MDIYTLADALKEKVQDPDYKAIYAQSDEGRITVNSLAEIADRRLGADLPNTKFVISVETNELSKELYKNLGISEEQRIIDVVTDANI